MLQQTRVESVKPYFERFMEAFPSISALASASEDEVLAIWAGLGYYSRAHNLLKAARLIAQDHSGELPPNFEQLMSLPGIGRSTAGAILAQAYGKRRAILDGNARRVLARVHAVHGWPGKAAVNKNLWHLAETNTPSERVRDYTQAIMDLGGHSVLSEPATLPILSLAGHLQSAAIRKNRKNPGLASLQAPTAQAPFDAGDPTPGRRGAA